MTIMGAKTAERLGLMRLIDRRFAGVAKGGRHRQDPRPRAHGVRLPAIAARPCHMSCCVLLESAAAIVVRQAVLLRPT